MAGGYVKPRPPYNPPPKVDRTGKPKRLISRQKRERMDRDAEYLALRDCYLEENPYCDLCGGPATGIHHIVSGTAGKPLSLRNPNTWLGYCDEECHDKIERKPFDRQVQMKLNSVLATIARLRT